MRTILIHQDNPDVPGCDIVLRDICAFIENIANESDLKNLIVVHGNNSDSVESVPSSWKEAAKGWNGIDCGENKIEFLGFNVCRSGGRLIVVSGGALNYSVQTMINKLVETSKLPNADFPDTHFHCIENFAFKDGIDWGNASRITLPREVCASDFVKKPKKNLNYLTALNVLCQGYGVMTNQQTDASALEDYLLDIGWTDFKKTDEAMELIKNRSLYTELVPTANWWLAALGEHDKFVKVIHNEWGDQPGFSKLEQLIEQLKSKQSLTPEVVVQAGDALLERLSKG